MKENWGLCKKCKWWQIEPEASIADRTTGLCIDEDLQRFKAEAKVVARLRQPAEPHHLRFVQPRASAIIALLLMRLRRRLQRWRPRIEASRPAL